MAAFSSFIFMHWVLRLIMFALYVSAAFYFLLAYLGSDSCFVKHTYRSEMASAFISNPLYTSTQIWRNPPKSMPEIQAHVHGYDQQKVSDIGVFPVIMEDMLQDSSFIPFMLVPTHPMENGTMVYTKDSEEYEGIKHTRMLLLGDRMVQMEEGRGCLLYTSPSPRD